LPRVDRRSYSMADFPFDGNSIISDDGGQNSSNSGVQSFSAGNGSKSAWSELISSTSADSISMLLVLRGPIDQGCVFDIGIGAASSEVVIVADQMVSESSQAGFRYTYRTFPMAIASGSRVAVRAQAVIAGTPSVYVAIYLFANDFDGTDAVSTMFTYGITGARGTQVDPGGTVNTKGAWTEIVASSDALSFLSFVVGLGDNTAAAEEDFLFDIATGGAGSEVVIVENLVVKSRPSESDSYSPVPLTQSIANGTRLSVRSQSTTNDATDRLFDVALYGGA